LEIKELSMNYFYYLLDGPSNDTLQIIQAVTNIIVAVAAIGALIFTGVQLKLSKYSKRGMMVPCTKPGKIIRSNRDVKPYAISEIRIKLINSGENVISKLGVKLYIIIRTQLGKNQHKFEIYFGGTSYCVNPLAKNQKLGISKSPIAKFISDAIIDGNIIGAHVQYTDMQLNRIFKDTFFWRGSEEMDELFEIGSDNIKYLKYYQRLMSEILELDKKAHEFIVTIEETEN